jgi:hypothetical protein
MFFFQIYIIYSNYSEIPFNFIFSDFSIPNVWALVTPTSATRPYAVLGRCVRCSVKIQSFYRENYIFVGCPYS